jgi:hypothetical protein
MTSPPPKRLVLRWTAPKNFVATFIFIAVTVVLQYFLVALTISSGASDPTAFAIPVVNVSISLLFHLLPVAVSIALAASFIYLTGQTATLPRPQLPKKSSAPQPTPKPARLKALRQFTRRIRRAGRRIKQRILQPSGIASFQRRVAPVRTILKSALIVAATFTAFMILVSIAAYPHIVPASAVGLHEENTVFHGFVWATIQLSQTVASAVPPLGAAAAAMNNALMGVAPGFRRTLEGAASSLTAGLVASSPMDKYLIIQNAAVWTTAAVTFLYTWYGRTLRRRR